MRGVVHLPSRNFLASGPTLHEFMHLWVLDRQAIPTVIEGHWGFSCVHGQLGGIDLKNLVELGGDKFLVGLFWSQCKLWEFIADAPLELHLASCITEHEVPDIWVAEDGEYQFEIDPDDPSVTRRQRGPDEFPVFKATRTSTWNIDQIVDVLGERVQGVDDSQKEFRVTTVLVGNTEFPVTQENTQVVRDEVLIFSVQASLRNVFDVSS